MSSWLIFAILIIAWLKINFLLFLRNPITLLAWPISLCAWHSWSFRIWFLHTWNGRIVILIWRILINILVRRRIDIFIRTIISIIIFLSLQRISAFYLILITLIFSIRIFSLYAFSRGILILITIFLMQRCL